jgi:propanol-preferring alcohol dehydrogenase
MAQYPEPTLTPGEVLLRVTRCGVCHTELDEIEERTPPAQLPVILGHQVVGIVEQRSGDFSRSTGERVGVAWIASACGHCQYCLSGQENLCPEFKATGRDVNGGYAEYMSVRADFVHPIPDSISDSEAAPLLCAGAVGYRALKLTNLHDGQSLGLMGFGGSNHIVLKVARHKFPDSEIFVFSRNSQEREFALSLGAAWAGAIAETSPEELDAIIDTTPAWGPDTEALKRLKPGGRLVINAIRKEEKDKEVLLKLDYASQLWMEKEIKSVANVTRVDVREFLQLAAEANIKPEFQEYQLEDANQALLELKQGKIRGAKVLRI